MNFNVFEQELAKYFGAGLKIIQREKEAVRVGRIPDTKMLELLKDLAANDEAAADVINAIRTREELRKAYAVKGTSGLDLNVVVLKNMKRELSLSIYRGMAQKHGERKRIIIYYVDPNIEETSEPLPAVESSVWNTEIAGHSIDNRFGIVRVQDRVAVSMNPFPVLKNRAGGNLFYTASVEDFFAEQDEK